MIDGMSAGKEFVGRRPDPSTWRRAPGRSPIQPKRDALRFELTSQHRTNCWSRRKNYWPGRARQSTQQRRLGPSSSSPSAAVRQTLGGTRRLLWNWSKRHASRTIGFRSHPRLRCRPRQGRGMVPPCTALAPKQRARVLGFGRRPSDHPERFGQHSPCAVRATGTALSLDRRYPRKRSRVRNTQ